MKEKNNNLKIQKKTIILIIILCMTMLLSVHVLRFITGNPSIINEESYFHKRIAEKFSLGNEKDSMVIDDRITYHSPYHTLISIVGIFTGISIASIIIPFFLGIGSLLLFYFILQKIGLNNNIKIAASLIFAVSPSFVYISSVSTEYCLSLFAILFSVWIYINNKIRYHKIYAILGFILATLINLFGGLILIIMLMFFAVLNKKGQKDLFFSILILICIILFIQPPLIGIYEQVGKNLLKEFVSEFGSKIGFGIFTIILSFLGIIISWTEKKRFCMAYFMIIAIFISAYFIDTKIIIYTLPLFSIFSGIGMENINNIKWEYKFLKKASIIVLICGLLFSALIYIPLIAQFPPNKDFTTSLKTLKEISNKNDIVLSHYSNGYVIQDIAGLRTVVDDNIRSIKDYDEKMLDIHSLFYAKNLNDAKEIIRKYNIKYIIIDDKMKNGEVWHEKNEGLLFLFRNEKTFKQVYSNNQIEIWEIIQ